MQEPTPGEAREFDDLRALIREELVAQIAIGRLGDIEPPAQGVEAVASLIADVVIRVYRLERRNQRSGSG